MCDDSALKGLYCIGLGPGDPELITIKALKILQTAGEIQVPKGSIASSLAMDILRSIGGLDGKLSELDFSMAKTPEDRQGHWNRRAEKIISMIETTGYCVCVTIGDPTIYSTMGYLIKAVKGTSEAVPITIVPGISSIQVAAVATAEPLAIGNDSFGVVPLPDRKDELLDLLSLHKRLVCMKVAKRLSVAVSWLEDLEDQYDVRLVRRASMPDQKIYVGIDEIRNANGNLSILIIEKKSGD